MNQLFQVKPVQKRKKKREKKSLMQCIKQEDEFHQISSKHYEVGRKNQA